MISFENTIQTLETIGLTDIILPFLLIFTIVFAVLQKIKIFGEGKKNFNVVISLVLSLSVIVPHVMGRYPAGTDVVDIINKALPNVALLIIVVIMVFIAIGLWGVEPKWAPSGIQGLIVVIMFAAVFYIFGHAAGWFKYMPTWLSNPQTQALIVILLVFGALIAWITRDSSESAAKVGVGKLGEGISKLFGKP